MQNKPVYFLLQYFTAEPGTSGGAPCVVLGAVMAGPVRSTSVLCSVSKGVTVTWIPMT